MLFRLVIINIALSFIFPVFGQSPVSHPNVQWGINSTFTDEFNSSELDQEKWDHDPSDWGTWSWEPENAYLSDTVLTLRMQHHQHVRGGTTYYFNSGIVRQYETFTYGYFEARIKASEKGQGTCPAFWAYSRGQPTPSEEGGVKYCEIDAIEIFQVPYDTQRLEMNLHARIIENGQLHWVRPGQGDEELCHNTWLAPWDPRDDYHTYGVWSRPDSIFWYVDGVERGAKKNVYWYLPMHLTVSMGLRAPYERYINGVRTIVPYPDSIPEPGFPTEMYCDYVRFWNTPPQLYADPDRYLNATFPLNQDLVFDCRYFAGGGQTVVSDMWDGVSCKLQEVQADGTVVQEWEQLDALAVGQTSGVSRFVFSLTGMLPSDELPEGNSYVLRPAFRSSFNAAEDVLLPQITYPVQLVTATTSVNSPESKDKILIINRPDGIGVQMDDFNGQAQISIYDLNGRRLYETSGSSPFTLIDQSIFPVSGTYLVAVKTDQLHRVKKVVVTK